MLVIVGCGNLTRGDDGVGPWVAQQLTAWLTKHPKSNVRIYDGGTAGMEVMFRARGSDALIVVDANDSGSEPGAIFEVPGEELANVPEPGYNLHDFRWDHALYVGRRIFREEFPADVTVYLVEREDLSFGIGLSDPVETAAATVVDRIIDRVRGIAGGADA